MRLKRVVVGAAVALAVFVPAAQASAHAGLEASVPSANAVLETGPPNIELDFNEAVDFKLADVELYDQSATLIATGPPQSITDDTVVQVSVPTIGDGVYVVVWRVPSADSHVVDGVFSFQVGVQSGVDVGALIDKVSGNAAADSTVGRLDTAARLLALIGLIVLIGGGLLAMQSADSASNTMLLWMAWVFLLVGSLGSFGLYGAKVVAGTPSDAISPSVWGKVVGSHTASVLLVRTVLVLVVGVLLLTFARRASDLWRGAALALAIALVVTYSIVGHAYAQHPAQLWVAVDAVHLAAISLWIGGLLMLAFGTTAWLTDPDSEGVVRRFSIISMIAVPVIVATGVAQTLKLAGNLDDVTSTSWGRTLLVKVAVVTVLIAIGGVSQWLLRNDGPSALKRNVLVEALIGIAVVGLAAALVALPPQSVAASKVFTNTLSSEGVLADVTVTPGRVGQNEVHLVITPPGGSLEPVVSTSVQATFASGAPVPATLESIGPNHYTGTITLSTAGDWNLQIIVEPTPGQSVLLSSAVPIPG
ncbi:MAG: copper resistance protein CopC [Ilumatobacteraceae bacterium]|nr:copper resistance protein CopC [Ilumatobacteraceae bacterium]